MEKGRRACQCADSVDVDTKVREKKIGAIKNGVGRNYHDIRSEGPECVGKVISHRNFINIWNVGGSVMPYW
jgi:hypothetical protein